MLLVTTGATATFHKLIQHVTSPAFVAAAAPLAPLVIQYGNAPDSKAHFSDCISGTIDALDLAIANTTNDKSVLRLKNSDVELECLGYTADIGAYIDRADLVVSHAGTGSIMDALRRKKPLIVVANPDLMDNHQHQVGRALAKMGCAVYLTMADVAAGRLEECMRAFKAGDLRLAPMPDAALALEEVLSQELGHV